MAHNTLTPVSMGLRTGLHVLFAALLALVMMRVLIVRSDSMGVPLMLAVVFGALYVLGAGGGSIPQARRAAAGAAWITGLTLIWALLLVSVPEAAYLVFPLFFLYLHVLPLVVGPIAVLVATLIAVVALGLHGGFTVGGVVGPFVGAGVALLIGLGHRALAREALEREALLAELLATRDQLAATEREQGMLTERSRLAREIHDTVAQGLSSIQMLLYAAEAADVDRPGIEHIRLARSTAADGLADTRRFIRELAPPSLAAGLGAALRRLGTQWQREGLLIDVAVPPADAKLSMDVQTALLRIAQGAVANVAQHAHASAVQVTLAMNDTQAQLTIKDDGVGFDPVAVRAGSSTSDSFGLRAIAERAEQLGGHLSLHSSPGRGTTIAVCLEVDQP